MANIFEINRPTNKITLGTTGTTINIASHTASKILALDGSKDLEVVTIGTSLDYTRPTLNTVQDIRTTASPEFASIELGHADDTTITRVSGGVIAVEGTTVMMVGDAPTSHAHDDRYYTETEIGDNYQPLDDELTSLAGLSYVAASFVKMTGANTFALRTLQETSDDLEATIDHDNLLNFTSNEHYLQSAITTVGTIASGTWQGTTIAINQGGTGQTTAQAAINTLSDVSGGTDEYVLTKDTGTGDAIWKAAAGAGTDEKVKIDSGATAGYLGTASGDGVLRTTTGLSYADGGNYITLGLSHLGLESLTDPNADRVMFWDDSESALKWLTVMQGVQINGTKLQFDVNSLTEITSVDGAADYVVVFDTSEANSGYEHKKVLVDNLLDVSYIHDGTALNGGSAIAIPTAGNYVTVSTGLGRRALCYLKLQNVTGAGWASCIVRDKDETGNWGHVQIDFPSGPARCELTNDYYGAVIVPCNADGDIEITSATNGDDWKIWLMGHI